MENNNIGHISESELDGLLGEAFLNLDFENNPADEKILDLVTGEVMFNNFLSKLFKGHRLDLLFLLLSIIVCLSSFFRYMQLQIDPESQNINPILSITNMGMSGSVQQEKNDLSGHIPSVKFVSTILPNLNKNNVGNNKTKRSFKKGQKPVIALTTVGKTTTDTLIICEENTSNKTSIDTVNTQPIESSVVSQCYTPASPPVSTTKKIRPEKQTSTLTAEKKKIKKAKRKKRMLFQRNGIMTMIGNTYRKSRSH